MNCVPQKCTRNPAIEDSGPCSGGWPRETKATARWEAHHCPPLTHGFFLSVGYFSPDLYSHWFPSKFAASAEAI